jgi:hypothetical protein
MTMINMRSPRRSLAACILAAALLIGVALAHAGTARADFEFKSVGVKLTETPEKDPQSNSYPQFGPFSRQAGDHPDLTFSFEVPLETAEVLGQPTLVPAEALHTVDLDLPLGMVGDPTSIPTCAPIALASPGQSGSRCPVASQVGIARILTLGGGGFPQVAKVGVYNVSHGPDVPARFGFNVLGAMNVVDARVRPGDYGISSGSFAITQAEAIYSAKLTLWGVPADPSHDRDRQVFGESQITGPIDGSCEPEVFFPEKKCPLPAGTPRVPFLSSPTSCSIEPVAFTARADSWEHLGAFDTRRLSSDSEGTPFAFEGCERLSFRPSIDVQPLSRSADSPAGLSVDLDVPQSDDPDGLATAHVRTVKMTLPQGMTVNAASATGLGACSLAEIGIGSEAAPSCPEPSKLGTVKIQTPVLEEELEGGVYLARQDENPFGSLLALYIAVKGPGFWLKLPGKIEADPQTGQLTTIFDNNPQLPFSRLSLQLKSGARAPLTTPSACGTYSIRTEITSWASPAPVVLSSPFTVDQNCATGGFSPGLTAGTAKSTAGAYSPFVLRITRADGEQNLSRIQATLPEGLLAKLGGVPLCGDAQASSGDCPAASRVGTVTVGAGAGPTPVYVPEAGKAPTAAYLAGPYKGAPYSLVVKVPAQAGPFDLGTVTVRNALRVDPTTTQVTAVSDPLPQILQGIPVAYRDVRVEVDRPGFTVNPTNCAKQAVTSVVTSATGQTASPQSPFQAAGCGELDFKPKLALSLKGGMKRSGNPALTAVLTQPKGDNANIAQTQVLLPKTSFIDNAHINSPCTRVQFNAGACPAKSILGTATAYSPLLDQPLTGPVYFRSNGGERELPDLVADLNGQIHVTLVGFIDSVKVGKESSRVRTRFQNVPDAPVSRFVLKLKGGKKGLIENSVDLCKVKPKATLKLLGQNGKPADSTVAIATSCGKTKAKAGKSGKKKG